MFVRPAAGWANGTETAKLTASDGRSQETFGFSVAASGDTLVAGAPNATVAGTPSQGAAYVFGAQGSTPPPASLAPDSDFEQGPFGAYFTAGPCRFAWTGEQAHSPTHSLLIDSASASLCRWLTQTQLIPVRPGQVFDASAFFKSELVQDGVAYLALNFWTAGGVYIPATVDSPLQLSGSHDWTRLVVRAKAPSGAAFVRLEFRLAGRGRVFVDDVVLSTDSVATTPPDTTITDGPAGTISSPIATFTFVADRTGSGFECSLDNAPFTICSSPQQYSALAAGAHTFAVRARDPGGLVDSTPATRSWTVAAAGGLDLAPDPSFELDPTVGYFSHGDGLYAWAGDSAHSGTRSLLIRSTSDTLNRWLSRTSAITATPGSHYQASVWVKTENVAGASFLSINFWTASGTYIPATVDSPVHLGGTNDWTRLTLEATAPPGAAYLRVELRQTGPGATHFDDVDVHAS